MPDIEIVSGIPVVNFSAMSIEHNDRPDVNDEAIQSLAAQVHQAFSTIGFVYLKNHGISQEQLNSVLGIVDEFFGLPTEVKSQFAKKNGTSPNGWDALERESPTCVLFLNMCSTNPNRPGDLKESFDVGAVEDETFNWPTEDSPSFQPTVTSFYTQLKCLGSRVLSVMAIGLGLDPDAFEYAYKRMGTPQGGTQLRFNFYPSVGDKSHVKPGQIRCGEHTDYGGITLLFQDDAGGLEVKNVDGNYVPAPPIAGTVLVNIADLMQRWTADKLVSTAHRVLIPETEIKRTIPRRSLVFFVDPDHDSVITCMDGSNKYPPIRSEDYIKQILAATYTF